MTWLCRSLRAACPQHVRDLAQTLGVNRCELDNFIATFVCYIEICFVLIRLSINVIIKSEAHHNVCSGWSRIWHCSNTGMFGPWYEQTLYFALWLFCQTILQAILQAVVFTGFKSKLNFTFSSCSLFSCFFSYDIWTCDIWHFWVKKHQDQSMNVINNKLGDYFLN